MAGLKPWVSEGGTGLQIRAPSPSGFLGLDPWRKDIPLSCLSNFRAGKGWKNVGGRPPPKPRRATAPRGPAALSSVRPVFGQPLPFVPPSNLNAFPRPRPRGKGGQMAGKGIAGAISAAAFLFGEAGLKGCLGGAMCVPKGRPGLPWPNGRALGGSPPSLPQNPHRGCANGTRGGAERQRTEKYCANGYACILRKFFQICKNSFPDRYNFLIASITS
jgi:hypothetical protein